MGKRRQTKFERKKIKSKYNKRVATEVNKTESIPPEQGTPQNNSGNKRKARKLHLHVYTTPDNENLPDDMNEENS
jgi:hypothetical protein